MSEQVPLTLEVSWRRDLLFDLVSDSGASAVMDGNGKDALSPMEGLLASFCGCMATDVVMILRKMRVDLKSLTISARGERCPEPPRYFRKIDLTFRVKGGVPPERVEHAIRLSLDRYCSVFHSLRKDVEVTYTVTMESDPADFGSEREI
jgi:putative redox protein